MNSTSWFDTYWTGSKAGLHWLKQWQEEWRLRRETDTFVLDDRQQVQQRALRLCAASPVPPPAERPSASDYLRQKLKQRNTGVFSLAASSRSLSVPVASAFGPGQIIALPAQPVLGQLGETFVFIIEAPSGDAPDQPWRVIPFSPLSIPATDAEWLTPWAEADPQLAVLSFWNSFTLPESVIEAGRLHLRSMEDELNATRDLWLSFQTHVTLSDDSDNVGPALECPDDPRQAYLDHCEDETGVWRSLVACPAALLAPPWRANVLALTARAAAPRSVDDRATASFNILSHEASLHLALADGDVSLTIVNEQGEPFSSWDGALLITPSGWATHFSGGMAQASLERLRDGFALVDPDCRFTRLSEIT